MIFLTAMGVLFLAASQQPALPPDGQAIYTQSCTLCHGEKGDGEGIAKFEKPARSFIDGGYAFGNTPAALFNTIANGIGGTPMPGFKGQLSEAQIKAVAAYVLEFAPQKETTNLLAAVLQVSDRPVVVRGGLKSYQKDGDVITRGVVLGGIDGLSVEYDTQTMAILAFRKGEFVQRDDWGDRGGALLQPLGKLLMSNNENENSWGFFSATGSRDVDFRFVATEVSEQQAKIVYRIVDPSNSVEVAEVVEYFEFAKVRYDEPNIELVVDQHIEITWLAKCDSSLFYGASYEAPLSWRVGRGLRLDQVELNKPYTFLYQYVMLDADTQSDRENQGHSHD